MRAWRSHPARGAWIEMSLSALSTSLLLSHTARGAWIEIIWPVLMQFRHVVAPRTGCVD